MSIKWKNYDAKNLFDELIDSKGAPRPSAMRLIEHLQSLDDSELEARRQLAEVTIQEMGVSFTVYTEEGNIDRAWPFDIIPRTISAQHWSKVAAGLKQRLKALNMFIGDLYDKQQIIKDGVVPEHIISKSKNFRPECIGIKPAYGVWAHICGTDLVRDVDGEFYVLEDNLRVPSGWPTCWKIGRSPSGSYPSCLRKRTLKQSMIIRLGCLIPWLLYRLERSNVLKLSF